MSVAADVSLQAVLADLALVAAYSDAAGLVLDIEPLSEASLRFYVTFRNRDGELFFAEFECTEFPLHPPTVEFVDAARVRRGSADLYPQGFHPTPCICMRYNRKAYGERGGPHGDWRLLDWRLPTGNGVGIDTLALIVSDLDAKVRQSSGRMG
jgi:hypothetical protein